MANSNVGVPPDTSGKLLRRLLLGTLQSPSEITPEQGEEQDPDLFIWQQVATQDLLQRAARPWEKFTATLPPGAPPEEGRPCSQRSILHLEAMLKGHHAPAIPEFIRLLHRNQRQLPAIALPQLLDSASTDPKIWQLIEPAIGERGRWLARQHPVWRTLLGEVDGSQWYQAASIAEKVALLHAFRQQASDAARSSLIQYWTKYPVKEQAKLLSTFTTQFSIGDEDFLQTQLSASRKELRILAADLLSHLPQSQYIQELQNVVREVLYYDGKQWQLKLPVLVPSNAKALGIQTSGSRKPGGLVLNWLTQLIARIPLSYWSTHSGLSPAQILRDWLALPQGLLLVQVVPESLLRHPDENWTRALIGYWLETNNETLWQQTVAKQLLEQSSTEVFNDSLLPWLEQYGPLVPEKSLPAYWLSLGLHAWSPRLSRIVIEGFRDLVREWRASQWDLYHYQRILQAAAYQSDTSIFNALRQNWQSNRGGLGRWSVEIEKLLQTLYFRLEMAKELQ